MISETNGIDIFDKERIRNWFFHPFSGEQCQSCRKVFGTGEGLTPCPNCGSEDKSMRDFIKGRNALILFGKIRDFFISNEKEMVVILFCILFEVLVNNFFMSFLKAKNTPFKEIEKFLQKKITISTKVNKTFEKFVGEKFEDAIKPTKHKDFYANWNDIKDKRNNFIHGLSSGVSDDDCKLAWKLTVNSSELFAFLNNKFCVKET